MRNIKLTIEYDGSRYQGWTRLGKNESSNTIFNKIQEVLRKMTGEFVVDLYSWMPYRSWCARLCTDCQLQD